ncbi:MAG: plasmid pRiA4b ORF-3 family protein [bacterium]
MAKRQKATATLQLKIVLEHTDPSILRQVTIPNNFTLHELHLVIQSAYNWKNCHLHMFYKGKRRDTIAADINSDGWGGEADEGSQDTKKTFVTDFLGNDKEIYYEYDLGDSWSHSIKLEKTLPEPTTKPKLLNAENYAPVEDCGGDWGWYEKLEFLANYPKKPTEDDKDLLNWLAELIPELDKKNPRTFNPTEINKSEIAARIEKYTKMN